VSDHPAERGSGAEPTAISGEHLRIHKAFSLPRKRKTFRKILMKYWLMKTEPDECSIDDALAAPGRLTPWTGVRNYQARNFTRDQMQVGDGVLFYHSSCPEPGIAGLAEVASAAYPDKTQFEKKSPYYD